MNILNLYQNRTLLSISTLLLILSIVLPINSQDVNKQKKIDDIMMMIKKADDSLRIIPYKSLKLSDSIINNSKDINYFSGIAEGYNIKGKAFDFLRNIDSSIANYQLALQYYEKMDNEFEKAKILNNIGIAYFKNNKYKQAEIYFLKTYDIRKSLKLNDEIAKSLNNLSILYLKIDKYDKALEYNLQLLDYYDKEENDEKYAQILTRIANIHYYMKEYTQAIDKFLQAAEIFRDNKNEKALAQTYTNLGIVYYDIENFDLALKYYEEALKYSDDSNKKAKGILLNNIGLIHKKYGNNETALKYIQKSINMRKESVSKTTLFHPLTSIAEIYISLKQPYRAITYLDSAEQIANGLNDMKKFQGIYELKSKAYENAGNYSQSLEYYKKYSKITDTLMNIRLQETTRDLNIKYDSEKRAEENKRLKHINRIQITYFSIISVLVVIIVLILFSRIKAKQKANKMLEEKNQKINKQHKELEDTYKELQKKEANLIEANATKDKFFSIIAHDLKNPIHAITLSSETLLHNFKKMTGESLISLITNIQKSGNHLSNLLENLLNWARAQQGRIEFNPIKTRICDLIENTVNYLEVSIHKKKIEFNNKVSGDLWLEIDPNMMQTVFRNLISNAIKFTQQHGRIEVWHTEYDEYHEFSIRDNGIGISEEDRNKLFRLDIHHTTKGTNNEAGTGLGLILCKEFVMKHGGTISVESIEGSGSNFIFTLPKK